MLELGTFIQIDSKMTEIRLVLSNGLRHAKLSFDVEHINKIIYSILYVNNCNIKGIISDDIIDVSFNLRKNISLIVSCDNIDIITLELFKQYKFSDNYFTL